MTVKFPFEVPQQDPAVQWPSPFEPKFNEIDRQQGLVFIDGESLKNCEMQNAHLPSKDQAVKQCIDETAERHGNKKVVALWTRQRHDGTTSFHSTGLKQ